VRHSLASWKSLFLLTFVTAYAYIFNEWLFAVTKPSFMNGLGFTAQIQILLTVSALLASLCFLCLLPLAILSLNPLLNRHTAVLIKLGGVLPTMVGAALILIVVDNFTYTVFRWGVVSTQGWRRSQRDGTLACAGDAVGSRAGLPFCRYSQAVVGWS
jgi:hypothetical protein